MKKNKPLLSLGATIALFGWIVVVISLGVADIIISENLIAEATRAAKEKSLKISRIVAANPLIVEALSDSDNDDAIQLFTQKILEVSEVDFITVLNRQRIRESHPKTEKIGTYYLESDAEAAFEGKETITVNNGSLGVSIRAFSPVFTLQGEVAGVVLVGVLVSNVHETIAPNRIGLYAGMGIGMLIGLIGSLLLARKIKKILFGLEPFAIAHLFEERNAMLQSVREGVLAVDKDSRVTIVNDEARCLFERAAIHDDPIGKKVDEHVPNTRLQKVLESGQAEFDQEQNLNGISILANRVPIIVDGEIVGAVATFRDKTEVRKMAEKLTGVSLYADALRAQTHEFMNKLHVIQGMIRLNCFDRLNNYVNQIAGSYHIEVGAVIRKIKDPVLAGFLLGKLSLAREAGISMTISETSLIPESTQTEIVHELITILGNLIDNSLEAVQDCLRKQISLDFYWEDEYLTIEVQDSGPGIAEAERQKIFMPGYSSKGPQRGLGLYLIEQSIKRLGGNISLEASSSGSLFRVVIPYGCEE